jgi:sterol desaturase/sphingolipid hydroxylase (fatty acid hydroxylase superfamily)
MCLCNIILEIQVLQTLLGLALGALGDGDVTGNEDYDLALWISRVGAVFSALPSLLYLTGVDFKTIAITLPGPRSFLPMVEYHELDIEVLIAKFLYWYIVPVVQIACALIVADACMYCIHRIGHTNKWVYSKC